MIRIEFVSDMTEDRRRVFTAAASRWEMVVNTGFPAIDVDGSTLTDLRIDASIVSIDGPQGVLGQAGPTTLRGDTGLPVAGIMQFDTADVERLEADGSFEDVILHEMGHVLGFGTLFTRFNLIGATGSMNPVFTGPAAAAEYETLLGADTARPVPLANTGGAGTREGHWRELIFGDELLTGFLSGANRPLSRLSIAAFSDMGYEVDFSAADDYALPTFRELAEQGVPEAVRTCTLCRVDRPVPVVLDVT